MSHTGFVTQSLRERSLVAMRRSAHFWCRTTAWLTYGLAGVWTVWVVSGTVLLSGSAVMLLALTFSVGLVLLAREVARQGKMAIVILGLLNSGVLANTVGPMWLEVTIRTYAAVFVTCAAGALTCLVLGRLPYLPAASSDTRSFVARSS
jgi:hypothetical protein